MELKCNNFGFVNSTFDKIKIDNIYSFVHLLDEPNFTHFTNSSPVSNLTISKLSAKYDKKFTSMFCINTKHDIYLNDYLSWHFETEENQDDQDFCFGIAFPVFNGNIWLPDNSMGHRIVNYSDVWIPPYIGQSNIDLPIIKVQLNSNTYAAVMLDFDHGSHFYSYQDNGQNYIKVGIKSTESFSAKIRIKIVDKESSLTDIYRYMYPASSSKIDFWKTVFRKIENLYKIKVYYDKSFNRRGITGCPPSMKDVIMYSDILWQELSKYPASFLREIDIHNLYLCDNLCEDRGICYAMTVGGDIIVNTGSDLIDSIKRCSLHHELYHCIEKISTEHKRNTMIEKWGGLEKNGFVLQKSLNTRLVYFNQEDVRAELFSYMMCSPDEIEQMSLTDNSLRDAIQIIKEFVKSCCPSISVDFVKTKSYEYQKFVERMVYRKEVDEESLLHLMKSYEFITEKQEPFQNLMIVGILGSGLRLSKLIFDSLKYFDSISIQGVTKQTDIEFASNSNLIFVVRDPCDLAELYSRKCNQDIVDDWLSINRKFIDMKLPFIRYEDIITGNKMAFSKLLNMIGRSGLHDFDYDIIDENKTIKYPITSRIHLKKKLNKRIELLWLGYQHVISEL